MWLPICYLLLECSLTLAVSRNVPPTPWNGQKSKHVFKNLTQEKLERLAEAHNRRPFNEILAEILVQRVPGTRAHEEVKQFIVDTMARLKWHVEVDAFTDNTPEGPIQFSNVIATRHPSAPRRLTLACHYDSKKLPHFVAATDSAVPCAMMIHLAMVLGPQLRDRDEKSEAADISLQLLFLDGEEAFVDWTETDSLYGARHLANKWGSTPYPPGNTKNTTELDRIDVMVLLDLLGAPGPRFYNWFVNTSFLFDRLADIESRLTRAQQNRRESARPDDAPSPVIMHRQSMKYFDTSTSYRYYELSTIQDDHIPFLRKGVPIVHMISVPFPHVWHTRHDDAANLDYPTIDNLNAILRVFVTEYLHLAA